jgi:large subunit ribosomal protein L25
MLTLEVKERAEGTSAGELRDSGFVPAVVYGAKEASRSLAINGKQLEHTWKTAGHTSLVRLSGAGEEKDTLIKDVQFHPVTGRILHADFYVLEKGKKVEIAVPLEFMGEAPAEKAGHILVKALHEIEIAVEPQDLPHSLPVDISILKEVGDHISASQIPLPKSATLMTSGDETIVAVTAFVEEKEPEPTAPAAEGATVAAEGGAPTEAVPATEEKPAA